MGLSQALTKGDANAIEKATDPGDNTKACGRSASKTEVLAPVDKKASRKENKKKVKEEKREARKDRVSKAAKKEGRSWRKPMGLVVRLW
ncbi:hypothetical protein ACJRO7_020250 [Eucalyptus globulus]|uniref:Uncharacterized protein n=1 Tax=Eucalyptus globulus TaxID=34317 RepID=A0ABD3KFX9_EUCGL